MVAEKLDFDIEIITKIGTAEDRMGVVLDIMSQRTESINILVEILMDMGRFDCIEILRRGGIVDIPSMDTGKYDYFVKKHRRPHSSFLYGIAYKAVGFIFKA